MEVHIVGQRGLPRVKLDGPDPLAFLDVRHFEEDVSANAALERGIDVGREVGGEDDHTGKALQLVEQHVDDGVGFPLVGRAYRGEAPAGDGVGFVEEKHRILARRCPEDRGDVLRRLSDPARLQLGVANDQEPLIQGIRERLGTDRLAGARRSGEMEGQPQSAGMPFSQAPLLEDEVVFAHQREGMVQSPQRGGWKDDIVEGAAGLNRLYQITLAGNAAK
jgi:hypothetical protein